MTTISIEVNGTEHELDVAPRLLLADLLRDRLGLTGTKIGCAMGACGACTVLLDACARR
jgi:aerobic carbon-monoxide dehydrogenase small subunit